jgi:hypothetical protein
MYDGEITFYLQRDGPTRCKTIGRASSDKKAPPRPAATQRQFDFTTFFDSSNKEKRTLERYNQQFRLSKSSTSKNKLNPLNSPMSMPESAKKKSPAGRKLASSNPFYESFIGTADKIVDLIQEIDKHRSSCAGKLNLVRKEIKSKGLCLKVCCYCELKSKCTGGWTERYAWNSAAEITITGPNDKLMTCFVPDVKHALAIATTPPLTTHINQVLLSFGLFPRDTKYLSFIEKNYIRPAILKMKNETIAENLSMLNLSKKPYNLSYDMGHNHQRNAQGSVSTCPIEGKIVSTRTNTIGSSVKRENVNLVAELDMFQSQGIDIASVTVDQNFQSIKEITSRLRVNAENLDCRSQNVQCHLDSMHSGGYFVRKLEKENPKNSEMLCKILIQSFKRGDNILSTIDIIIKELSAASNSFFKHFIEVFQATPGLIWKEL